MRTTVARRESQLSLQQLIDRVARVPSGDDARTVLKKAGGRLVDWGTLTCFGEDGACKTGDIRDV